MKMNKILRKLARSVKYRILYSRAKELGTLKLFNNNMDLTKIQIWFLYWLEIYDSLYTDLSRDEDFISSDVIEDDLRSEAYLLFRREKLKKKKINTDENVKNTSDIPSVIFRRK